MNSSEMVIFQKANLFFSFSIVSDIGIIWDWSTNYFSLSEKSFISSFISSFSFSYWIWAALGI